MSTFSDLKIFPMNKAGSNLLARGSVVVHNAVKFQFSVLNGSNGRFVALPSEKSNKPDEQTGKIKYYPIVSLATKELSEELTRLVLAELDGGKSSKTTPTTKSSSKVAGSDGGIPF